MLFHKLQCCFTNWPCCFTNWPCCFTNSHAASQTESMLFHKLSKIKIFPLIPYPYTLSLLHPILYTLSTCQGKGRLVLPAKAAAHLKPPQMYSHLSKARRAHKPFRTSCPFLRNTLRRILTVLRNPIEHSWEPRMVYHPGASHNMEEREIFRKWC